MEQRPECVLVCMLSRFSRVQLFETPWTVDCQAPLSIEFSRQEHWSGLPFLPPGDLPDPGIEHTWPASPALADGFFTTEPPRKPDVEVVGEEFSKCQREEEGERQRRRWKDSSERKGTRQHRPVKTRDRTQGDHGCLGDGGWDKDSVPSHFLALCRLY